MQNAIQNVLRKRVQVSRAVQGVGGAARARLRRNSGQSWLRGRRVEDMRDTQASRDVSEGPTTRGGGEGEDKKRTRSRPHGIEDFERKDGGGRGEKGTGGPSKS
ncbi:hypothetical protein FOPE_04512 [Fonsecaea pedrosoi]|nr:hypothetical protein FOPE_04512 [Fonsecaea pedrosoi]